jgi:hypothetical protein
MLQNDINIIRVYIIIIIIIIIFWTNLLGLLIYKFYVKFF